MSTVQQTTQCVREAVAGDAAAADRLIPLIYDELRALAEHRLRREPVGCTLQATAIVHEAYLRMVDQTQVDWRGQTHFFAISARMIRRILVDYARRRMAQKRGGDAVTLTLDRSVARSVSGQNIDVVALDEALRELADLNQRQARVVELRFFGGLSVEETALALDVSERTVKGDWRFAKAWLRQKMMG